MLGHLLSGHSNHTPNVLTMRFCKDELDPTQFLRIDKDRVYNPKSECELSDLNLTLQITYCMNEGNPNPKERRIENKKEGRNIKT